MSNYLPCQLCGVQIRVYAWEGVLPCETTCGACALRKEGAAVAFGLMGMAEAIRANAWRYELVCAWCDCRVDGEPVRRGPHVFCDGRCVSMFDANP